MPGAGDGFAAHYAQAGFTQERTVERPHTRHARVDSQQPVSQQDVHAPSSWQTLDSSNNDELPYQQMHDWDETSDHPGHGQDMHANMSMSNGQGYV